MRLWIAGACFAALAACGGGGGGKAELVKACTDDGESAEMCNCMADAAEENLKPATFQKLVQAAKEGDPDSIMSDLTPEEQGEFMTFAMQAGLTCTAS
ncbi:MAG: hypothetical protein AAFX03_00715 [Pseudomonadota bacterium]